MTFKLIIKEEAQLEVMEAFLYYERKQNGLGEIILLLILGGLEIIRFIFRKKENHLGKL